MKKAGALGLIVAFADAKTDQTFAHRRWAGAPHMLFGAPAPRLESYFTVIKDREAPLADRCLACAFFRRKTSSLSMKRVANVFASVRESTRSQASIITCCSQPADWIPTMLSAAFASKVSGTHVSVVTKSMTTRLSGSHDKCESQ